MSTSPEDLQVDQIEAELLASTAPTAIKSYGVTIEQVRLERISLPEENVTAVFAQMRAERRQFATKFQAEGEREASKIRAEASLEAAKIRAHGEEEAARIRGESAAEIAKTYADAHKVDPELYRFQRSLESLDRMVTGNSSLILRTDSEPFSRNCRNAFGHSHGRDGVRGAGDAVKRNVIVVGDVRQCIKDVPDGSVDSVITSPPYFLLRNYGSRRQMGLEDDVDSWVGRTARGDA